MIVALSPYLLTTREPAAMVALLLADQVVTVVPSPEGVATPQSVGGAAGRVSQYLELLETWAWSMPLWHAGVIGADYLGEDAIADIRQVRREIDQDDRFAPLRPLMHAALDAADDVYLRRFAGDLLKGGPDPALTVPVAAGIDRFAGRLGLVVARSEPASIVAKQEAAMLKPVARFAVPTIVQSGGQRLVAAREDLHEPLEDLREAIHEEGEAAIRRSAGALADAFEAIAGDLTRVIDPDEPRTIVGMASVTIGELPVEAVQRSSTQAAGRMLGRAASSGPEGDGGIVRTMIVRRIGARTMR
ncbi:MAG: hypothetical protein AAFR96_00090 [Planctomycetota bacterium]